MLHAQYVGGESRLDGYLWLNLVSITLVFICTKFCAIAVEMKLVVILLVYIVINSDECKLPIIPTNYHSTEKLLQACV